MGPRAFPPGGLTCNYGAIMGVRNTQGVVIAIGNQKGGVGKTTNTVHIAAALGLLGYSCLIVDLDPAAGATRHLGVPTDSFAGTLELLTSDETVEGLTVASRMPPGVALVPARPQLAEIDVLLSKFVDRTRLLQRPLDEARVTYDYILLDTGPSPAFPTTVAAYAAADWFLLSAFAHPLSLGGLTEAFRDIGDVRQHRNPSLEVLGIIFTNIDRRATRLRQQLEQAVSDAMPGRRFATSISQAVIVPEVSGQGITLFQLPGWERLPVAMEYLHLAGEVDHRVRHRDAFIGGNLPPVEHAPLALEQ